MYFIIIVTISYMYFIIIVTISYMYFIIIIIAVINNGWILFCQIYFIQKVFSILFYF